MQSDLQRPKELRYQRKRQSSPGCPWMSLIGNFVLKRGLSQQQGSQSPKLSSPRPLLISSLEMTYLLGKECVVIRGNIGTTCQEALAPMWAKRKRTFMASSEGGVERNSMISLELLYTFQSSPREREGSEFWVQLRWHLSFHMESAFQDGLSSVHTITSSPKSKIQHWKHKLNDTCNDSINHNISTCRSSFKFDASSYSKQESFQNCPYILPFTFCLN